MFNDVVSARTVDSARPPRRRRAAIFGSTALAIIGCAVLPTGTAAAQELVPTTTNSWTFVARSAGVSAIAAGAPTTIKCTFKVNDPHPSTHQPGTINVEVTVTCDSVMPQILIGANLLESGKKVAGSGDRIFVGKKKGKATAAITCADGSYQGFGFDHLLFPPGFSGPPQSAATSGFSKIIPIKCK